LGVFCGVLGIRTYEAIMTLTGLSADGGACSMTQTIAGTLDLSQCGFPDLERAAPATSIPVSRQWPIAALFVSPAFGESYSCDSIRFSSGVFVADGV
jgi:hypothetical protein